MYNKPSFFFLYQTHLYNSELLCGGNYLFLLKDPLSFLNLVTL